MITAKLLRDWGACWFEDAGADARIAAFGRTSMSPREIAADERVTLDDRLWVLCRALWYRDENAARTFAIDSAALVSHLAGRPEDQAEHARLVADLRRIYALPASDRAAELDRWDAALDAARDAARAAWDAARDAARAAWDAARDAARAAWDAAWDAARAAWDAARDAARDAWDAAWDAEMRKALDRALVALGADVDGWTP